MSLPLKALQAVSGFDLFGGAIESIQYGNYQHTSSGAEDITISTVDKNNCILEFSFDIDFNNTTRVISGEIVDNATIRFKKSHSATGNISWRLIEFKNVSSRQEATITSGDAVTDVTISEVDVSKTKLFVSWSCSTSSNDLSGVFFQYFLQSPTNLRIATQRPASFTKEFKIQIIEFK